MKVAKIHNFFLGNIFYCYEIFLKEKKRNISIKLTQPESLDRFYVVSFMLSTEKIQSKSKTNLNFIYSLLSVFVKFECDTFLL